MENYTFLDAVKLARKLHADYDLNGVYPKSPMFISAGRYAQAVQDKLQSRFNNPNFLVVTSHKNVNTEYFYGMCSIYPDLSLAGVTYTSSKSTCWERFIRFKELTHHYTGYYQDGSRGSNYMIDMARTSRKLCEDPQAQLDPECFALCAAIEIILPWKYRGQLGDLLIENRTMEAAVATRVPLGIISSIEGTYADLSGQINRNM